jgi:hypothetical protein
MMHISNIERIHFGTVKNPPKIYILLRWKRVKCKGPSLQQTRKEGHKIMNGTCQVSLDVKVIL